MLYQILQTNIIRIVRQTENWITINNNWDLGSERVKSRNIFKISCSYATCFQGDSLNASKFIGDWMFLLQPFLGFHWANLGKHSKELLWRILEPEWHHFHIHNLLHPNISIHSLGTLLYTFPLSLTRRIHLTINAFNVGNHISFILAILMDDSAVFL